MARTAQPLITRYGRVISGVYYGHPGHCDSGASSLPTIPPERVGLNGEYDYYGLAKRVQACLHHHFDPELAARLTIQQRGSAILVSGKVANWQLVERLAQLILQVDGATQVEFHNLQLSEALRSRALPVQWASVHG